MVKRVVVRRRRPFKKGRKLTHRQATQVKKLIARRQELKYNYFTQAAFSVTATANLTGIPFDIPQGTTDSERDGDRIQWAGSVDLRLEFVNGNGATADVYNNLRFIIFQWHGVTSTVANSPPKITDILLNGPTAAPDMWSCYNHDTRDQYRILFDRCIRTTQSSSTAATTASPNTTSGIRSYKISLRKCKKYVQFQTGGSQATNRLFIIYFSDSALATHPQLTYSTKVFFRDS